MTVSLTHKYTHAEYKSLYYYYYYVFARVKQSHTSKIIL